MSIKKEGRINTFMPSPQQNVAVPAADVDRNQKKQFESGYKDWVDEQNTLFERQGLWCADLRVW